MKTQTTVGFQDYFLHEFLSKTAKAAQSMDEENIKGPLLDFVSALMNSKDIVDSIETMAQYPGTSDLSIFFADILENIVVSDPDEVSDKIESLSQDLIEMFRLLHDDESWQLALYNFNQASGVESSAPLIPESSKIGIREFCDVYLENRFGELAENVFIDEKTKKLAEQYFHAANTGQMPPELLGQISDTAYFESLIDQLKAFVAYRNGEIGPDFADSFFKNVDEFLSDFFGFVEKESTPSETVREQVEDDLPLDELVEQLENREKKAVTPETTVDSDLQNLISSYVTKEVNENVDDINRIIDELLVHGDQQHLKEELVEAAEYFVELGSVHNVEYLDVLGHDLKKAVEEFMQMNIELDATLARFLKNYVNQIPDIILGKKFNLEEWKHDLTEEITNFRNHLTEKMLIQVEDGEKISITANLSEVLEAFDEVHNYYWGKISKEYAEWLSHKHRETYAKNLITWIEHLKFWYNILNITFLNPALKYLVHVFKKLEYGQVPTPVDAFIQEFLMGVVTAHDSIGEEEVKKFIDNLQGEGIELDDESRALSLSEVRSQIWPMLISTYKDNLLLFANPDILLRKLRNSIEQLHLLGDGEIVLSMEKLCDIVEENFDIWMEEEFTKKIEPKITKIIEPLENRNHVELENSIADLEDACLSYKFDKEMKITPPTIQLIEDEDEEEIAKVDNEGSESDNDNVTTEKLEEEVQDELEALFMEDIKEEKEEEKEYTDEDLNDLFLQETLKYITAVRDSLEKLKGDRSLREELNVILRSVHSIKGSARMMKADEIADFTELLEDLYTALYENNLEIDDELIELTARIVDSVHDKDFSDLDYETVKLQIDEELAAVAEKEEKEESAEKKDAESPEETEEKDEEPEGDYFVLSEQDEELIKIFKDESDEIINQVKGGIKHLESYPEDKKIVNEIDQGIHKINSAAKMLGFSEIGVIMDALEELVELHKDGTIKSFTLMTPVFDKAIEVTSALTNDRKIAKNVYYTLIEDLDKAKEQEFTKEEEKEPETKQKAKGERTERENQLLQLFVMEAREYLQKLREYFADLEVSPDDNEKVYDVFRLVHTLKGAASMVKVDSVQKLSHAFEDVLERYYQDKRVLSASFLSLLRMGLEEFEYVVGQIQSTGSEKRTPNFNNLLKRISKFNEKVSDAKIDWGNDSTPAGQPNLKMPDIEDSERNSVKISIRRLNELMNLIAELVINDTEVTAKKQKLIELLPAIEGERKETNNLLRLAEDLKKQNKEILKDSKKGNKTVSSLSFEKNQIIAPVLDQLHKKLEERKINIHDFEKNLKTSLQEMEQHIERAVKLTQRLHNDVLQARMVPISHLFDRFPIAAKNIAKKNGKRVKLVIEGGHTELDRLLVEHLYEPLLHSIRNAIDHGIEDSKERKKAGKPVTGVIKLSAKQEKGHVLIKVEDDGRGVSLDKIRKIAVKNGLIDEDKVNNLSEQELLEFLFYPTFSTSDEISEISGRGIGLDVVKREVNKIKGDVFISSEPGEGTTLTFKFPMTLTVTQTILVKINEQIYGIPVFYIDSTFDINRTEIIEKEGEYFLEKDGVAYPVLFLQEVFKHPDNKDVDIDKLNSLACLVTEYHGSKYALIVDYVEKRSELIIRALSPNLKNIPYISGGAVMPDASITFIIDVDEIIEDKILKYQIGDTEILENSVTLLNELQEKERIKVKGKPNILILDDSETFKAFMLSLLSAHDINGYPVSTVEAAWEMLKKEKIDLALIDLELPSISGYDFIAQLQNDNKFKKLPIMIITGKKVDMVELLARDLGVLGYILKPFSEEKLMEVFNKLFKKTGVKK